MVPRSEYFSQRILARDESIINRRRKLAGIVATDETDASSDFFFSAPPRLALFRLAFLFAHREAFIANARGLTDRLDQHLLIGALVADKRTARAAVVPPSHEGELCAT